MVSSPMVGRRSIVPLVSIFALIASATVAACGRGQQAPLADYAVYAEYSLSNEPMVAGWNTRVFNKKEVQEGGNISLDDHHPDIFDATGRLRAPAIPRGCPG